jgi:heat shock protein HslJ
VKKPPVKTPATKPSTVDTVKPVTSGTPASTIIDGSIYRMVTYKGIETPPDSKYTISFDNGYISAKICNSMSGSYYVEGILLKAGNLVSTKMYCTTPPGVMEVETTLDTMLTFGVNMYVSPNKVTLVNSQGIIMVFAGFTN